MITDACEMDFLLTNELAGDLARHCTRCVSRQFWYNVLKVTTYVLLLLLEGISLCRSNILSGDNLSCQANI